MNQFYFNRVEKNQENIFNNLDIIRKQDIAFDGLKTFDTIKCDTIQKNNTDIIIEDITIKNILKGQTFNVNGNNIEFSASAENAKRISYSDTLDTKPFSFNKKDTLTTTGPSAFFSLKTNYNEANNICIGFYRQTAIQTLMVPIRLQVFGYIDEEVVPPSLPDVGQEYRFLYTVPAGVNLTVALTHDSPRSLNAFFGVLYTRRCKYPIVEDEPVKVYSTDFTTEQKRAITYTDFTTFRIG
jgi:hypothetical protein